MHDRCGWVREKRDGDGLEVLTWRVAREGNGVGPRAQLCITNTAWVSNRKEAIL